ncbi:OmpA family protein [Novilysobacter spongiicola]|uniref:Outer membrane protein OmpA n=1 Tax=Lysobacter spongiicola DSM 21749 TaxID=1122188 RepID=A0A1T4PYA6_9GAMM|nr:OmpA family protein [Lysobacter spongiicola]SJZ96540.1 Outer membrane protein OmpA [Lysobacter spongiicola DSM 21749]
MNPFSRRHLATALLAVLTSFGVAACGGDRPGGEERSAGPTREGAAPGAAPVEPVLEAAAAGPAAPEGFEVGAVPVSEVALGDFPYFTLPAGYGNPNKPIPVREFDRVAVWTGDRLEWVEGRIFESFVHAEPGKGWSLLEVIRNLDHQVSEAGGVKVTESKPPNEVVEAWGEEQAYSPGRGDIYNEKVLTWLVRRADRNIWLHFVGNTASGSWMVVESEAFKPTAALLPASELKQQLDSLGKVALEVNFATDKAEILPESKPQIEQVAELLRNDPELRLSVNGHTDDTGDAARNQQLSEERATSVVAALTARGVSADRLQARGFGQDEPVADNATEAGKARNRRVELVAI